MNFQPLHLFLKKIPILCFCFLMQNLESKAQTNTINAVPVFTYQNCVEYAQTHNIQLKQLQLNALNAQARLKQSEAQREPAVRATLSNGASAGRVLDPIAQIDKIQFNFNQQWGVSGTQLLYNGNAVNNTIALRKMEIELAKLNTDNANFNINLSLLNIYMQIILAEAQLEVLTQQAKLTQTRRNSLAKLIQAGVRPEGDMLDIDAQEANDNLTIENAKNNISLAYLGLQQTLDYYTAFKAQKPAKINLPTAQQIESEVVSEKIFNAALQIIPQAQIDKQQTKIANQNLLIARNTKKPTINATTGLGTSFSSQVRRYNFGINGVEAQRIPYFEQLSNNIAATAGISIIVPILNNQQTRIGIEQANINIKSTELTAQANQNTLRRNVEQACLDVKNAYNRYNALQISIHTLEKNFAHIQKKYEIGASTNLEYITSQNALTTAQLNLLNATYDLFFKLKIIDYYQGKPIVLE